MTRCLVALVPAVAALGLSACSAEPPASPATSSPTSTATMATVDYYRSVTSSPPGLPTYELTVTAGGPVDIQFRGLADFTDPSGATTRDYRTTLGGGTWVQTIHGSAWDDGWTLQVDRTNAAAAASTRDTRPLSCEVTIRVPGGPVLHVTDATNEPSGTATCSVLQAPRAARAYTPAAPSAATQARTRQPSSGGIQGCNVAPQNYSAQWRAAVRSGSVPE